MDLMDEIDVELLPQVRKRIKALKNLQIQEMKLNGQLEKEALKVVLNKFGHKLEEIRSKRKDIISGTIEPTKEECSHEFEMFDDSDSSESEEQDETKKKEDVKVDGIPKFWLRAMMNCGPVREFINHEDEEALKMLTDITVKKTDLTDETFKLSIEFHFGSNDFFKNRILIKEYTLKFGVNPDDPWMSATEHAFYPIKATGTTIEWKKGQKLTEDTEDYNWTSFFDFFVSLEAPEDKEKIEDYNDRVGDDWTLASYLANKLVPNAVLFYTGDLADEEDSGSDSSSDSPDYSDDSEDD